MNKKCFKPKREEKRVRVISENFVKKGEVEYYRDLYEDVSHKQRETVIDFTNVKKGYISAEYFIKNYNSDLLISEKLLTDALSIPIPNPRVSFRNILIIWLYVSFKLKALFIGSLLSTLGLIYPFRVSSDQSPPSFENNFYFLFPFFMAFLTIETIKESTKMYKFFFQRSNNKNKKRENFHLITISTKKMLWILLLVFFGVYTFISYIYLSDKSKNSLLFSLNPLPIMNLILYFMPLIVCSTAYLLNNELKNMGNYGPLKNWKKTEKPAHISFLQSKCQIQEERTLLDQYQLNIRFYGILSFIYPMFKEKGSFLSIQHYRKKQYEKENNFPVFPSKQETEEPGSVFFIFLLFLMLAYSLLFVILLVHAYALDVFLYFLSLLIIVLLIELMFRGILIFKKNYQDTLYLWKKVEKFGIYNGRLMITLGEEMYQSPPITQIRRVNSNRYIPKLYLGEGQTSSLLIEMSDSPNFLAIGYTDKDTISYKENTKKQDK